MDGRRIRHPVPWLSNPMSAEKRLAYLMYLHRRRFVLLPAEEPIVPGPTLDFLARVKRLPALPDHLVHV